MVNTTVDPLSACFHSPRLPDDMPSCQRLVLGAIWAASSSRAVPMLSIYRRALSCLAQERRRAAIIAGAILVLGALALLDPIVFGGVVAPPGKGPGAWVFIILGAGFSALGVRAGVPASIVADRLS